MAPLGQCCPQARRVAVLRHRFRGAPIRRRETREAGLLHGLLKRSSASQSQGINGANGLPPGSALRATADGGLPHAPESYATRALPEYLDTPRQRKRSARKL